MVWPLSHPHIEALAFATTGPLGEPKPLPPPESVQPTRVRLSDRAERHGSVLLYAMLLYAMLLYAIGHPSR